MSSLQILAVPNGKQHPEGLNREKKTFAFEQFEHMKGWPIHSEEQLEVDKPRRKDFLNNTILLYYV